MLRLRALAVGVLGLLACALATAEEGFRFPGAGASFSAGTTVEASWIAPCDRDREHEGELVLSLDDGRTFPIRLTGEMPACLSGHAWRVPDVATTRARLGLRRGHDGEPGEERIVLVSAPFAIVAGDGPGGAGLIRGAAEWWTREALAEFEAEDFLDQSLGREPEWSERLAADGDAENPDPVAIGPTAPSRTGVLSGVSTPRAARREIHHRIPPPLPLRL